MSHFCIWRKSFLSRENDQYKGHGAEEWLPFVKQLELADQCGLEGMGQGTEGRVQIGEMGRRADGGGSS